MVSTNGREAAGISAQLFQNARRFDFFQAVRLLERLLALRARTDPRWPPMAVGEDAPPQREVVRFRALPSLSFPPTAIHQIRQPSAKGATEELPPPEMVVTFLGMTGPSGVLPHHYTRMLLRRTRDKDFSLRDWLDLFHHRLLSLFYRGWQKYRVPLTYERARLDPTQEEKDIGTRVLFSLIGLGTAGLRKRQEVEDETFLFYAGLFSRMQRSAVSLELMLTEYFQLPIEVHQLQGHWLQLETEDQAQLPCPGSRHGRNNRLAVDLVVGTRIYDVQSKFRLKIGPLRYSQFYQFMPGGPNLGPLGQLTRSFVGPQLVFDVQLLLKADEVPWLRLGASGTQRPYLGWNTWLRSQPFTQDVDDAVFAVEDG
jgi:type VI secretion system protein ImpH